MAGHSQFKNIMFRKGKQDAQRSKLFSKLSRACFHATVYLDPPEPVRFHWKVKRDTAKRGYQPDEVKADLGKREVESAAEQDRTTKARRQGSHSGGGGPSNPNGPKKPNP